MSSIKEMCRLQQLANNPDFSLTDLRCWETHVPTHIRDEWHIIPLPSKIFIVDICEQVAGTF